MTLEERDHLIRLFETYENLLTEHQQEYFRNYYLYDLSLQEIAETYGVSRNAIFDQIKKVSVILNQYEDSLHLCKLKEDLKEFKNDLSDELKDKLDKIVEGVN